MQWNSLIVFVSNLLGNCRYVGWLQQYSSSDKVQYFGQQYVY
jgi:hypothetical protein